jgi:hypothetical protein
VPELNDDLPENYCVSLNAMSLRGEGHRFSPEDPHVFALNASLGGLAILNQVKALTGEQLHSYHLMRLVYQHGPRVREALQRKFVRATDLSVSRGLRGALGYDHILPASLGLDASGRGRPWSIARLMEAGKKEADARRLKKKSDADYIRLGLLAGARLNPVDIHDLASDDVAKLVRLALFDLGPAEVPIDETTKDEVIGRFLKALHNHLEDSDESFNRWFFKNRDGIVHAISKQTAGTGPIDRAVVREVLLELVFHALRYTGQCVHVQMFDFLQAIEPSLSEDDEAVFEVLYLEQPWLAGIPLVVLHRYFAPLREAIEDLWADPRNPEKAGVLLRLLQYHGEVVSKRREADRTAKEIGPASARRGQLATASEATPSEAEESLCLQDLGTQLLRDSEACCDCGTALEFASFDHASSSNDTALINAVCRQCQAAQQRRVSFGEAYQAVYALEEAPG